MGIYIGIFIYIVVPPPFIKGTSKVDITLYTHGGAWLASPSHTTIQSKGKINFTLIFEKINPHLAFPFLP